MAERVKKPASISVVTSAVVSPKHEKQHKKNDIMFKMLLQNSHLVA